MSLRNDFEPIAATYPSNIDFSGFKDRFKHFGDYKKYARSIPGQTMRIELVGNYSLGAVKYTSGNIGKFIHVDCTGTVVNPGSVFFNDMQMKGFFTDYAVVKIWFGDSDVNNRISNGDIRVVTETPASAPDQNGQISSSMNFNVNASVGTFGGDPTATEGVGFSMGTNYSHGFQDFTFQSQSQKGSGLIEHRYFMEMTGDGHKYNNAKDIVDVQHIGGPRIYGMPLLSTSNLPLPTQAVFQLRPKPANDPFINRVITLNIYVYMRVSAAFTKMKGFDAVSTWNSWTFSRVYRRNIDFSQIKYEDDTIE